ncbi:hypothetical protein GGR57DRAFT_512809 [Xylariaceae sp. FL1272]|nr:hypothetical protein GGR57DRAFT_512809 [Xylariaceae sp. FL1272]
MKFDTRYIWFVAVFVVATPTKPGGTCTAQDATSFSLIYGEPLASYARAFAGRDQSMPINHLHTETVPADANLTAVVKPNVDTLYSDQCFDVSAQDIVITVPEVDPARFYSVSLYSPYGDNFVGFGSFTDAPAGKYLLTLANSSATAGTLVMTPDSEYAGIIHSPMTLGYLLVRVVLNNNVDDVAVVNEIQYGFKTELLERAGKSTGPVLSEGLMANTSSSTLEYILDLTARFRATVPLTIDEPIIPAGTNANLTRAGVSRNGTYEKPDCVNLNKAAYTYNSTVTQYSTSDTFLKSLDNGWVIPKKEVFGTYGDNYLARTSAERYGYLANTFHQAAYPLYEDGFSLGEDESYTIRFGSKPPLAGLGFWSLTAYDLNDKLIDNEFDRYALGDRSELEFPDGELVYGSDADGPFEILVQASEPRFNWTSNWLPSPRTPGRFNMLMRIYVPTDAIYDGTWSFPTVTKGAAKI